MESIRKSVFMLAIGLSLVVGEVSSFALELEAPDGFTASVTEQNAGGGFDYLPDGDVLALSSDFVNGPALYRFDGNLDGSPESPETVLSFDPTVFPSFVKVSPDGVFALIGSTGTSTTIKRLNLAGNTVTDLVSLPGNFDLAFIDSKTVYISANPGGFDPSQPNRIYWLNLNDPQSLRVVAEIADTPSGPIALNQTGDLYYIKGTWAFPAPALSSALLRFSTKDLAASLASGRILGTADAEASVLLDGGYDLAINRAHANANDIYISALNDTVLKLTDSDLNLKTFLGSSDSGGSPPSISYLGIYQPELPFASTGPLGAKLGLSAATTFFSTYSFGEVRPEPRDSDKDGALDYDENRLGSAPDDPGSTPPELKSPVHSLWNGFLKMINILELVNTGDSPLGVTISLLKSDGTLGSRTTRKLAPNEQFDFILNDLGGFSADAYGLLRIDYEGDLDGRLTHYRPGDGEYDFVFTVPLANPLFGPSAVSFNTYQPSLAPEEQDQLVANWLSIVNLGETPQLYTIEKYNQSGEQLSVETALIPPGGRRDLDGGHQNPGPGHVGVLVVTPADAEAPYLALLTRYGSTASGGYNFALPLLARAGNGRMQYVPISRSLGGENWLEIINTRAEDIFAVVRCYGPSGGELKVWNLTLEPHTQFHLQASSLLSAEEHGMCSVAPNTANSIISESMRYFRTTSGKVLAISGVQAREVLSQTLVGAYNLFIDMTNVLRLTNTSTQSVGVRLDVFNQTGSVAKRLEIPPHGTTAFDLDNTVEFSTFADTYGVVETTTPIGAALLADVVRTRKKPGSGEVDFVVSTPAR